MIEHGTPTSELRRKYHHRGNLSAPLEDALTDLLRWLYERAERDWSGGWDVFVNEWKTKTELVNRLMRPKKRRGLLTKPKSPKQPTGRPPTPEHIIEEVRNRRVKGHKASRIAQDLGIGQSTVYAIFKKLDTERDEFGREVRPRDELTPTQRAEKMAQVLERFRARRERLKQQEARAKGDDVSAVIFGQTTPATELNQENG